MFFFSTNVYKVIVFVIPLSKEFHLYLKINTLSLKQASISFLMNRAIYRVIQMKVF